MKVKAKLRQTWTDIRRRCYLSESKDFRWYGAKGIKVCDRWTSFDHFYADMLPGYFEGATIDRVNSAGDYTPENCQWLTRFENTSRAHKGKKVSQEQIDKTRLKQLGRKHSEDAKNLMKEKAKAWRKEKVHCIYCNRYFDKANFSKSHGEKCKCNTELHFPPKQILTKEERSEIQKEAAKKRLKIFKRSEYCNKSVDVANFAKHHGIKCKFFGG